MMKQLSFNIAVDLTGILGMAFILFGIGFHFAPQNAKEKRLCAMMLLFVGELLADLSACVFYGHEMSVVALNVAFVLKLMLGNALTLTFVLYLRSELELRPEQWRKSTGIIIGLGIGMALLMLSNPWHNLFFLVPPPTHSDCHGRGFWGLCLLYCLMMGVCLIQVLISREVPWQRRVTLGFYCLLHIAAFAAQPFVGGFPLVNIASLLSILVLSSNFYMERNQKYTQQELELQSTRAALVLSQIQPHFLFNSMTAVMDLCDTDPREAKAALQELSDYLHYKISALSGNFLVSFAEDLEFLQNYLKLEKRRFGPRLNVEYDIGAMYFWVPLLTLQPLAENAVRHGLSKRPEGGTIRIVTREIAEYYSILIEDNGVGFHTGLPADTSGSHVGLNNVRTRLTILCGGSLTVRSTPGVGTTVEITIRKEKEESDHENSRRG